MVLVVLEEMAVAGELLVEKAILVVRALMETEPTVAVVPVAQMVEPQVITFRTAVE